MQKKRLLSSITSSAANTIDSASASSTTRNSSESIKQILKYVGSATNEEEIPNKIKELNSSTSVAMTLSENSKSTNSRPGLPSESSTKASKIHRLTSNGSSKDLEPTRKRVNYVVLSKKRGLTNDNEDIKDNSRDNDATREVIDDSGRNKSSRNVALDQVNIIDVISSEYFDDEKKARENEKGEEKKNKKSVNTPERIACNGVEMVREKCEPGTQKKTTAAVNDESTFVYDIYYVKANPEHLDLIYPNNIEIKSYGLYGESELMDDNESSDEKEDFYEDDEDSNDEQNWRNDYPDEDDDDDIDDEDDDEYESSSRRRQTAQPQFQQHRSSHHHRSNPYFGEEDDDDENDVDQHYDEYAYGYDEDDPHGKKLASYMKKSLAFDRSYNKDDDDSESDKDYDEYRHDVNVNEPIDRSYNAYKKRILKEFKKDYPEDV